MSYAVSRSSTVNRLLVKKNTSPPPSLASKNPDSSDDAPEEINDTQPPDPALNVALDTEQLPTPSGSNSYTSSWPFTSCGTSASLLSKNNRPLSDNKRD
jgi:hypothetical protein